MRVSGWRMGEWCEWAGEWTDGPYWLHHNTASKGNSRLLCRVGKSNVLAFLRPHLTDRCRAAEWRRKNTAEGGHHTVKTVEGEEIHTGGGGSRGQERRKISFVRISNQEKKSKRNPEKSDCTRSSIHSPAHNGDGGAAVLLALQAQRRKQLVRIEAVAPGPPGLCKGLLQRDGATSLDLRQKRPGNRC